MDNELTVGNWSALKDQATMLVKSGFLPVALNTPEKAIAVALTSKELGIGIMEGFRSINVIQGKPTISPQLMLALANRTGQLENIEFDSSDERCRVTVTRKGRKPHTEEFGVKEATGLGLIGRDNYKKQPAIMFRWRALAANLRVTFPDVMLGFYTPEELSADVKVTEDGEMEVVQDSMINTGVRVPAGFKDMTPEEKQERIGTGNEVRNTPNGAYIFSPKEKVEEFAKEAPAKIENKPETKPQEATGALINHDEQLELFRLLKEKKIHPQTFKKALKDEFGLEGSRLITKEMYPKVYEWLIKHAEVAA